MTHLLPARTTPALAGSARPAAPTTDELLYDAVAGASAALVITTYSSSFGLTSRLLRQPVRDHVRNVYALVRLADEIVDGPMSLARPARARELLDRLERDTLETLGDGYSTNLIVHAFASTARRCQIQPDLIPPFFASMRTDLTVRDHDQASFAQYVYGSAEVVGLMCLQVFLACRPDQPDPTLSAEDSAATTFETLAPGARRLGSAFQKVNFLRDLAADFHGRGRSYFPDVDPTHLTETDKHRLLDDIDADLVAAHDAISHLPANSRTAVAVAQAVFGELSTRLRQTPAATIMRQRVGLSAPSKARVAATVLTTRGTRPHGRR